MSQCNGCGEPPRGLVERLLAAFLIVAVAAGIMSAQGAPPTAGMTSSLGPKDGMGLSPTDTGRVTAGTVAPDFTLESKDGGAVTLSQFRGRKTVVLVFYRGHW